MRKLLVLMSFLLIILVAFVFGKDRASAEEWIDISTPADLLKIQEQPDGNFRLVNDIDVSQYPEMGLLLQGKSFNGVFDGQGYKIINLKKPLFAVINGGQVLNLGLENVDITDGGGGITNSLEKGSKIKNSYVTGKIAGSSGAGLVLQISSDSIIENSYADVILEGTTGGYGTVLGGLVGSSEGPSSILNSYAKATILGKAPKKGGLIASVPVNGTRKIENSYFIGYIDATDSEDVGGIVGYKRSTSGVIVELKNVYARGKIEGKASSIGSISGLGSAVIETSYSAMDLRDVQAKYVYGISSGSGSLNTYYNNDLVGDILNGRGSPKTTEEMYQKSTYLGWDFENVWDIEEGKGYPFLRNMPQGDQSTDGAGGDNGNGSGDDNGEDDNTGNDDGSTGGSNEDSGDDEASVGIGDGGLKLTTSPIIHFGNHNITNEIKTIYTSFERAIKVEDLRGTHEGWRLDVSATPFKVAKPAGGFKEGTTAHELPKGSFAILPPSKIERVGNGSSELPTSEINSKTVIDNGTVTIANAEKGTGTGEFDIVFPENALSLVIDPETVFVDKINYPNTYTPYKSTLTWNLVSAP